MKTRTYMTLTIAGTFAAVIAVVAVVAAINPSTAVYAVETVTGNSLVEAITDAAHGIHASTK